MSSRSKYHSYFDGVNGDNMMLPSIKALFKLHNLNFFIVEAATFKVQVVIHKNLIGLTNESWSNYHLVCQCVLVNHKKK